MKNGNGTGLDPAAVKAALGLRAEEFAQFLYPGGRREGIHWVVGDVTGSPGKSFKVCVSGPKAGLCKDFAGDKACSLIDAYMGSRGVNFAAALSACAEWAGLRVSEDHPPAREFDWSSCRDALTPERAAAFAAWRGYSEDYCERLRQMDLLGLFDGFIALPVRDHHGACIGAQYFRGGSRGCYIKDTPALPLIIGDVARAMRVFVFESPWDAFAYYERCDLDANEAILSTRGASHGAKVGGRILETSEVIVFRQNDKPDDHGRVADDLWFASVLKTLARRARSVRVPDHLKDLNDWTQEGATGDHIRSAVALAPIIGTDGKVEAPLVSKLLSELTRPGEHSDEILKHRFLCRGGGLLLVGPSGIGKSSLSMQAMILWALGWHCFNILPGLPIRSLLIQAENDEGDLAEMRDGIMAGLKLTDAQRSQAGSQIHVHTCDDKSGVPFVANIVTRLMEVHRPDLLWIDPALAYVGGNVSSQEIVGGFLRNMLNPLLHRFNAAAVIVHHTNKPPTGKEKSEWAGGDFAYLGAGSAEWANWARAVVALRSLGSHDVFELRIGKRGSRVGWLDVDGTTKLYAKQIAHSKEPGAICWRDAAPDEIPVIGAPKRFSPQVILDVLGKEEMTTTEWRDASKEEAGVGNSKFYQLKAELVKNRSVYRSPLSGNWNRKP